MVVAEFSINPITDAHMRPFIDAAVAEVKKSGLKYEVEALSTTVEGEMDQVLDVVRRAHESVRRLGASRVVTEVRIDDRGDGISIEREVGGYR